MTELTTFLKHKMNTHTLHGSVCLQRYDTREVLCDLLTTWQVLCFLRACVSCMYILTYLFILGGGRASASRPPPGPLQATWPKHGHPRPAALSVPERGRCLPEDTAQKPTEPF